MIKHTKGDIVKWEILKKQVEVHLETERDAIVTTLIDYYGIYQKLGFPEWETAERIADKNSRMDRLEHGMKNDIADKFRNRFMPYLQLHEFEGLLFNEISIFHQQIPAADLRGLPELEKAFRDYSNPEMINNTRETSPSHGCREL